MTLTVVTRDELIARYIDAVGLPQDAVHESGQDAVDMLVGMLDKQVERYQPDGWMLMQCVMMDSSQFGRVVILPFGPNNTHKEVPDKPVSISNNASDQYAVEAVHFTNCRSEQVERWEANGGTVAE